MLNNDTRAQIKPHKEHTILFLGANGFPYGSATIQRQIQLAKSLQEASFRVAVINNRSPHSKSVSKKENISTRGSYQKIEYFYTSLITYKPTNFLFRNVLKVLGITLEIFAILYYRLFKNAEYIFFRTSSLDNIKYYYFVSRVFRMKLIYDYVEFYDSLGNRDKNNLNDLDKSFDHNFYKYADKLIVISDFLEDHVKNIAPEKLTIKVPPIIDFSYFDDMHTETDMHPYFLYCGSASYMDIVMFIIEAFVKSDARSNNYKLRLVINGSLSQLNFLNKYVIEHNYKDNIEIRSKLSYSDLVCYYKSAMALLIPIGSNIQDQARFPFKICEYVASKRPIITSDSGGITEYFEDNVNAFIAKTDNIDSFTNKLNLVMEQPEVANKIGENGYELGRKVFNYKAYSDVLKNFIQK